MYHCLFVWKGIELRLSTEQMIDNEKIVSISPFQKRGLWVLHPVCGPEIDDKPLQIYIFLLLTLPRWTQPAWTVHQFLWQICYTMPLKFFESKEKYKGSTTTAQSNNIFSLLPISYILTPLSFWSQISISCLFWIIFFYFCFSKSRNTYYIP